MKYFSLFSGAGGFELGIERAYVATNQAQTERARQKNEEGLRERQDKSSHGGHQGLGSCTEPGLCEQPNECSSGQSLCVGFSEIDKYASAVLKYHYPNIPNYGDIQKIDWSTVPDFDLLVGGSPCQDLSVAGKQKGLVGERSGLFYEYVKALEIKKPPYFVWENVKGALSSNGGRDFAAILSAFSEAGYSLTWQVLNAKDFGVPQNRERVFIVGTRGECEREVFFETRATGKDNEECTSTTIDANYGKGIDNHGARTGIMQLNTPKHSNDRVYGADGIAPTLNTMQGGMRQPFIAKTIRVGGAKSPHGSKQNWDSYKVGGRIRRLTPIECERLMSWHDDWTRYGNFDGVVREISDSQRYKMCGNGVVSEVIKHIINNVI